jgi:hypothetical protein
MKDRAWVLKATQQALAIWTKTAQKKKGVYECACLTPMELEAGPSRSITDPAGYGAYQFLAPCPEV